MLQYRTVGSECVMIVLYGICSETRETGDKVNIAHHYHYHHLFIPVVSDEHTYWSSSVMNSRSSEAVRIGDPTDLSHLYFSNHADKNGNREHQQHCHYYYVGPIRVDFHPGSKGRCLRAERDIEMGELLFVTPPLISAPVDEVYDEWSKSPDLSSPHHEHQEHASSSCCSVAEAAERVLLRRCRAICGVDSKVRNALSVLQDGTTTTAASLPSIDQLLGRDSRDDSNPINFSAKQEFDDERLLQIIRRNAFGADFITDAVVERKWRMDHKGDDDPAIDHAKRHYYRPPRLLGHYPLAAMLNHSCRPNAVRVFCHDGETMVVHACQRIAQGNEIVWSYIPLTQSVEERRQRLQKAHGFICQCERCQAEAAVVQSIRWHSSSNTDNDGIDVHSAQDLEALLSSSGRPTCSSTKNDDTANVDYSKLPNATQRYLRVSHLSLYMDYLNRTANCPDLFPDLLQLCTQLHFALASCHNASTEHLSVRRHLPLSGDCFMFASPYYILTSFEFLLFGN